MSKSILIGALVLAACCASLQAQSRNEKRLSATAFRGVGNSQLLDFTNATTGLNSISSPYRTPEKNSLFSSQSSGINNSSPFRVKFSDTGGVGPINSLTSPLENMRGTGGGKRYSPLGDMPLQGEYGEKSGLDALLKSQTLMPLSLYGDAERIIQDARQEPIRSLVPPEGGAYSEFMQAGEKAFREGDYPLASAKYRMANYIGQKNPECLLSLSHAHFAGRNYSLASFYLRQAILQVPRLAAIPLLPKSFYGDPSIYVENIQMLDEHLLLEPADADAQLLMAYYSWYDVDAADPPGEATRSLSRALAGTTTPAVVQAVETFWEGMVASGKVKGTLKPELPKKPASGAR